MDRYYTSHYIYDTKTRLPADSYKDIHKSWEITIPRTL